MGYVKSNAVAGRAFAGVEAHLAAWTRDVADRRMHGTTGEPPIERFARDEALALRSLPTCGPFMAARELVRRVGSDCAVELDTNACSVPWRLIGEQMRVPATEAELRVTHAGREAPCHARSAGRRGRIVDRAQVDGMAGADGRAVRRPETGNEAGHAPGADLTAPPALLRPLAEYGALAEGSW